MGIFSIHGTSLITNLSIHLTSLNNIKNNKPTLIRSSVLLTVTCVSKQCPRTTFKSQSSSSPLGAPALGPLAWPTARLCAHNIWDINALVPGSSYCKCLCMRLPSTFAVSSLRTQPKSPSPLPLKQQSPFWGSRAGFVEDSFSTSWGQARGWFGDDSRALLLLCTLFLLLLHQLHLRSSGIRSQRLGTPALKDGPKLPPWPK